MGHVRTIGLIFSVSFALNFIWENVHSLLYTAYQGGPITEFILLRATLGDAVMLTVLAIPFIYIAALRRRLWLVVPVGVALAVWIELYALGAGRWSYNELMPLVPFVQVGVTPTVQLALLGWVTYWYVLNRQV
jgi:hypothetical protein